jgi:hypothetical protein
LNQFFEVELVYAVAEVTKGKLPSEFKFLFQSHEKRMEKVEESLGHKLRDLLAYPDTLQKKINFNKNDHLLFRKLG